MCLQETKAQEHQLPPEALDVPEFTTAFVDAEKKGYSGVAIYARRKPDRIVRGLGIEEYDAEGRFVRMDFGADFSVASLYVPSGTSGPARQAVKEAFLDRFIAQLVQMKNEGRRFVICGDYNIAHRDIDVFDPKSCARMTGFLPQERAWFDDVTDRVGWVDAFRVVNHRAAAVLVVGELSGRVDAQSRLAHRLPTRHPEPCAGRARGVDLQGRAVLRPRAR